MENARQGLGNLLLGELGLGELAAPGANRAASFNAGFGLGLSGGAPSVGLLENLSALLSGGAPSSRGISAALAEEMGIRVSGADGSGSARGANITDTARPGRSNAGAPSISQIQASHGANAGMPGSGNANSMELVFQGLNSARNLPPRQPQVSSTDPPAQYDTQLFGGQAVSSLTVSTVNPRNHPLLQNVQLAPVTSLQSIGSQRSNSATPTSVSTSFIAGPGGQMMRVSDRDDVSGMRRPVPLAGWMDGGASSGPNEEDFSVTFGSALDSFLQAASRAQAIPSSNNDLAAAPVDDQGNEEAEEAMEDGSADVDNQAAEAPDAAPADDDDDAVADGGDDVDGPPENNPAEESIEDSSAPVAGGVETDNNSSEELPEGEGDDAMEVRAAAMETGEESVPDQDEEMADHGEDDSAHGSTENQNEEMEGEETMETGDDGDQAMDNAPGGESSNNVESQLEGEAGAREGHDSPGGNQNNEDIGSAAEGEASGELTCPPDIDPEVFASLPPEMQQEIVSSHQETHSSEITGMNVIIVFDYF